MTLLLHSFEHAGGRGAKATLINPCLQGAIVTLTKGIALETAEKNIRCNCIAPGPVWTPLVVTSFPTEKVGWKVDQALLFERGLFGLVSRTPSLSNLHSYAAPIVKKLSTSEATLILREEMRKL